MRKRTGVYSSGIVANLVDKYNIVLYQTNIRQAGKFIDELLSRRDSSYIPPILMSDALLSNRLPLDYEFEHSLCNSHGLRQFAEELYQFSEEVEQVLTWYGTIWQLD